jgi:hypothetical protein
VLALALSASGAAAQEGPVPVPEGYVSATLDLMAAQAIGRSCPTLSVDPVAAQARSAAIVAELTARGITAENIATRMADPREALVAGRDAFLARTGLDEGATAASVCAAGRAEIGAGTGVGALLAEVPG